MMWFKTSLLQSSQQNALSYNPQIGIDQRSVGNNDVVSDNSVIGFYAMFLKESFYHAV